LKTKGIKYVQANMTDLFNLKIESLYTGLISFLLFYCVIRLIPHSIAGGIGRNHFICLGTIVRLVPLSIACGISGDQFISFSTVVRLIPLPIPRGIGRYYFLNGKTSG
jgi:hypothetical protein